VPHKMLGNYMKKRLFGACANDRIQVVGFLICSLLSVVQFVFVLGALERPAHAYVDPGSGLLFFQAMSASLAGAAFFLRKHLRKWLLREKPSPSGVEGKVPKAEDELIP
jgi:hypothetical protein